MIDDPVIQVRNLSVYYGKVAALRNVSAVVPRKMITAVIGPSGCGKTTLLKSMNRLLEIYSDVKVTGEVLVDGVNVYGDDVEVTELRRKVGLITQTPNPLPMSIFDNVAYGPKIHGNGDKEELHALVERCLRSAGLWGEVKDRLKEPAANLSIGQQQRLNLARVLSVEPEVLLCDEPTSALDPISAGRIEALLRRLSVDYTIIMVTHTLRQARRLSDYAVFMYMGELVEQNYAEKFFNEPDDPKTREYIEGLFG